MSSHHFFMDSEVGTGERLQLEGLKAKKRRSLKSGAGFTLVEMIVAIGLFSVVMLVAVTALLSLIDANRKAQALQSVINNLNISIEGMTRAVREGSNYRCGASNPSNPDCLNGGVSLYFEPYGGDGADATDDWVYLFDTNNSYCGTNVLCKSETGAGGPFAAITSTEVTIESLRFYVMGATRGNDVQPKVMIVIKGTAGSDRATVRTTFHVQSTAVQRVLDI
jgi:prepilin-type N-terminal cleavage/methylation domain-containing protein